MTVGVCMFWHSLLGMQTLASSPYSYGWSRWHMCHVGKCKLFRDQTTLLGIILSFCTVNISPSRRGFIWLSSQSFKIGRPEAPSRHMVIWQTVSTFSHCRLSALESQALSRVVTGETAYSALWRWLWREPFWFSICLYTKMASNVTQCHLSLCRKAQVRALPLAVFWRNHVEGARIIWEPQCRSKMWWWAKWTNGVGDFPLFHTDLGHPHKQFSSCLLAHFQISLAHHFSL